MSTEVKKGDRVRISYEGIVSSAEHDRLRRTLCLYTTEDRNPFADDVTYTLANATVEVLERAKPKIGDVFVGREIDHAVVPVGTLLQYESFAAGLIGAYALRTADGWAGQGGGALGNAGKWIVRYLPEAGR